MTLKDGGDSLEEDLAPYYTSERLPAELSRAKQIFFSEDGQSSDFAKRFRSNEDASA